MTFVVPLGFVALVLGATVVGAQIAGVDVARLMRDPLVVAGAPALTGFVSNLGVLLWSAAAGACFAAALGLWRRAGGRARAEFFAAAGGLTSLLVLDDVFQLHEEVIPGLFGRGETLAILIEDGAKLAGIALWLAYSVRAAAALIADPAPAPAPAAAEAPADDGPSRGSGPRP